MAPAPFLAIAGNIGTGKSTLAGLLAKDLGWDHYEEPVEDNPYLAPFYDDIAADVRPSRAAALLQKYFLFSRALAHLRISGRARPVVQDRTVWEDREVFARALHRNGFMEASEYEAYTAIYEYAVRDVRPPTLMVFLVAPLSTLRERILTRGRGFEADLADPAEPYLGQLQRLYRDWMDGWTVSETITVDSGETDFVNDRSAQEMIVREILSRVGREPGLFDQ